MHAYLVRGAKVMQLDAPKHFRVFGTSKVGDISKAVVNTRWLLAWKMADGQKCVKARQAAGGFRDPDLKDGNVDASGCVSLPPSHLLVISLGALKTWKTWSDDIKIPLLEAAGSGCDVFVTRPHVTGSLECTSHSEIARAGLWFE